MAAGLVEGGSDVLNVLSDPVGNLIGKPLAVAGVTLHDAMAPMLGYHKFTPEERAALFADDVPQPGTRIADAITDNMRAARSDPNRAQEVKRQSNLLQSVHDAMEGGVNTHAAQDAAAVQAGTMAPEDAMMARVQTSVDNWLANRDVQAGTGTTGFSDSQSVGATAGGGTPSLSRASRAGGEANGGPGSAPGHPGLQGQAPLTPNFDAAAQQRYADARQATADRVATYRNAPGVGQALQQGPTAGSFRAPDSAVPSIIVKTGPQGADVARAYVQAGGSTDALSNAAAYSLRQAAMRPDGTLDPVRYQAWAKDRAGFLSQIPDAAARFGAAADAQRAAMVGAKSSDLALKQAAATAQRTVDDAMAARADASKALQTSVLGKFLNDADPVARVGSILRDKAMGRTQMAQLAKAVEGNADAKAGLQRAVAEHIQRDLIGNSKGVASAEGYIRNDRFQTFLRDAGPALREVMTPEQMDGLRNVGASLEQSSLSSQVGVGSPTAQLTAGRGGTLLDRVGHEIAGAVLGTASGGGLGFAIGGPVGAYAGGVVGSALGKAVQAAREAGIQSIEHLKTEALLNPELFRVLMTKVTRQNEAPLANRLAAQLRRISLVGAVQASAGGKGEERPPARTSGVRLNPLFTPPPPVTNHLNGLLQPGR